MYTRLDELRQVQYNLNCLIKKLTLTTDRDDAEQERLEELADYILQWIDIKYFN